MPNKSGEASRRKRNRMFRWQGGLCHWCGCQMTLDRPPKHEKRARLPKNYATFDHLFSRLDPRRRDWKVHNKLGLQRIVLACWQGNNDRAKHELTVLLGEQRRRSGHGEGDGQEMAEGA